MGGVGFLCDAVPVLVVLGETFFNGPVGEEVVDVRLALSVVAGVDTDSLTKQLLDGRLELRTVVG